MNKYLLKYPSNKVTEPVISQVVLETGAMINILRANVDYNEGIITISVLGDEKQERKVVEELEKQGIEVIKLEQKISKDADKCIDCGACISLCPTNAISFNEDREIVINDEECIRCEVCVEACPLKAISIQMGEELVKEGKPRNSNH